MNYDCLQYKSSQEPRQLPELHEARGLLESVSGRNGFAVASFEWGAVSFPAEMESRLAALVGKNTEILRLDNRFYVREVGDA